MSTDRQPGPSDYALVAQYLRTLQCPACGGLGGTVRGACKLCAGTGFKDGEVHLLVSAKQVRR